MRSLVKLSPSTFGRGAFVALAALSLAACGNGASDPAGRGGRGGPTQVGYVVVNTTSVPLMTQLGGRVVAFETSEVRPQVNGLIRARYFEEGSVVRKGQPLYQIDPSLYRAAVNQAAANNRSGRTRRPTTPGQVSAANPSSHSHHDPAILHTLMLIRNDATAVRKAANAVQ